MAQHSYGLVPYRRSAGGLEVLIGHLGGPFWARKDERAWSFPKGLPEGAEEPLDTARREFAEELGLQAPTAGFVELGDVTQSGGKIVTAWAVETDVALDDFAPGTFELEWPPRSGVSRHSRRSTASPGWVRSTRIGCWSPPRPPSSTG